ncbi:MAG: hypothetical protein JO295_06650 [Verrucomicrobia bacterium]|nr:hypothetical protein [Verrucomicrobiota bacterium]
MIAPLHPPVGIGQIGGIEPGPGLPGGVPGGFDYRHLLHQLIEKSWIVALCTLAGLFLALGYLSRAVPLYQSRVTLQVDIQDPNVVNVSGARAGSLSGPGGLAGLEALNTITQNLRNRALLARVVRAENLTADGGKALLGTAITASASTPAPAASASPNGSGPDFAGTAAPPTPLEDALAGALSGMVNPVIRRGTRLIDVFVTHRDPALAKRLADAIGTEYIRASIARRATFNQDALRFLIAQAEGLRVDLQKAEQRVAEFKEKNPNALYFGGSAASTGGGGGQGGASSGRSGLVESRLEKLSSDLTAAKAERARLESELAQVERAGGRIDALLNISFIANSAAVVQARRDLSNIQGQVAALAQRYKDKHPRMIAAKAALSQAEAGFAQIVLEQPALLRSAVDQARANETTLASSSREQEGAALDLSKTAIEYQELARQSDGIRQLYEKVLNQIKETDLAKGIQTDAVSVSERATQPGGPISPQPTKAVLAGVLGGLAIGLGLVFLLSAMDRTVKTVDQAESTFGLPVLAAVPEVGANDKKGKNKPSYGAAAGAISKGEVSNGSEPLANAPPHLVTALAPEGPVAESFRSLRAALSLLGPEAERRVFLFTSALPGEGKSFTCANYSLALAQQGYRVLLIDGDLRRPSQHKFFPGGDPQSTGGIVDYLVGLGAANGQHAPTLADLASPIAGAGGATNGELLVLTGGRRAPNPAELLGGRSFGELISDAAQQFDRVVIDSAPLLAVSDTLLMLPWVQTTCIVVRARKTPRNAITRALALLVSTTGNRTGGGTAAGLILNRLPRRRGVGYYYYYTDPHGYGDSYTGRGYEADKAASGREGTPPARTAATKSKGR